MSAYYDKAYALTETVKSPFYNKRYKYGMASIAEIKKGAVVFVFGSKDGCDSVYDRRGRMISSSGDREFTEMILRSVEPYEPVEWRDKLVFQFGGDFPLSQVINKLVEMGLVTPDQVLAAAKLAEAEAG